MFLDRRLTRRHSNAEDDTLSPAEARAQGYATEHCWLLEFAFRNDELAAPSPVAEIVDALVGAGLPETARQDVHTVLNELYINALDYGVLGLDSNQKSKPDDFSVFHELRDAQLKGLRNDSVPPHWVKVDCELNIADRPVLILTVADSGAGSISESSNSPVDVDDQRMNNRGLKIVSALVDEIQFYGKRNQIRVSYRC